MMCKYFSSLLVGLFFSSGIVASTGTPDLELDTKKQLSSSAGGGGLDSLTMFPHSSATSLSSAASSSSGAAPSASVKKGELDEKEKKDDKSNAQASPVKRLTSREQLALILKSPKDLRQKLMPLALQGTFEEGSKAVRAKIAEFFEDDKKLQAERLKAFDKAYALGMALFQGKRVPSLDYMLVHMAYAALMSEGIATPKILPEWFLQYMDPEALLISLRSEEGQKNAFLKSVYRDDQYYLPVVSKTGHFGYEFINECYAHGIACAGIPLSQKNDYDGLIGTVPIDFADHDIAGHALLALGMIALYPQKYDGPKISHAAQRKAIWADMLSQGRLDFHLPYFIVFHEDGYFFRKKSSPIQDAINICASRFSDVKNLEEFFVERLMRIDNISVDERKYPPIVAKAEMETKVFEEEQKKGTNLGIPVLFGDKTILIKTSENPVTIKKDEIDMKSFVDARTGKKADASSSYIFFKRLGGNEEFFMPFFNFTYGYTLDLAQEYTKLYNKYAAVKWDFGQGNAFHLGQFRAALLAHLEEFNEYYGHYFAVEDAEDDAAKM